MAAALIAGLANKLTTAADIHVVDPNADALARLRTQYGVTTASAIDASVSGAEVIVLAVKPQSMREVAAQLLPCLNALKQPLVVSIAAGIRAVDLSRWLGGNAASGRAIVRCMPNTPALIGMGITGMVAAASVSERQKTMADDILKAVGTTVWLDDEAKIDAVTALSGSGPAYVFYFIEAMQQAGGELGLSAEQGTQLAMATFAGAAQLALRSAEPVSLLRERVTSKGGTTYAALTSMEDSGVKAAIVKAIQAAAHRGKEMGDELGAAD
jgi:pyrroline-5-carboxylate reductase